MIIKPLDQAITPAQHVHNNCTAPHRKLRVCNSIKHLLFFNFNRASSTPEKYRMVSMEGWFLKRPENDPHLFQQVAQPLSHFVLRNAPLRHDEVRPVQRLCQPPLALRRRQSPDYRRQALCLHVSGMYLACTLHVPILEFR